MEPKQRREKFHGRLHRARSIRRGGAALSRKDEFSEQAEGARFDNEKNSAAGVEGKARNGTGSEAHAEIFTGIDADQGLIVDYVHGANRARQNISRRNFLGALGADQDIVGADTNLKRRAIDVRYVGYEYLGARGETHP